MKSISRRTKKRVDGSIGAKKVHSNDNEIGSCKSVKQKKVKNKDNQNEVVNFVEDTPTASDADIRPIGKSLQNKSPGYNRSQIKFLQHKNIQCTMFDTEEEIEMTLPDDVKPLLINVTFLLHEMKQNPDSKRNEDLCNIISKMISLLAELSKRPIKRMEEAPRPFDEIADKLELILTEHGGPEKEQYEALVREIKGLEQEVSRKESEVKYVRDQIQEERDRFIPESTSFEDCLQNSIRRNHSLRAEIKYNKAQFRKYEKILLQNELMRQKSLIELNNLRRKCAMIEESSLKSTKSHQTDSDVHRGSSLNKCIKSKIRKDKKNCFKPKKAFK